jgi:hypothetical protein
MTQLPIRLEERNVRKIRNESSDQSAEKLVFVRIEIGLYFDLMYIMSSSDVM